MFLRIVVCFIVAAFVIGLNSEGADKPDIEKDRDAAWEANNRWDYTEAIRLFSRVLEKDQSDVISLAERGLLYTRTGDLDRAMTDASRAVQLDPKLAGAYYVRGIVFRHRGELDKAIADLSEAIRLEPDQGNNLAIRGDIYMEQGEVEKAMADYDRAIELEPENATAFCERGDAKAALGDYAAAAADFLRAQKLKPEYSAPYVRYAWLLATCYDAKVRDPEKAIEYAKIGLDLKPNREDAWSTYAAALASAGRFDEAVEWQQRFADSKTLSEQWRIDAQSRVELYKSQQPFIQPAPPPDEKPTSATKTPAPAPNGEIATPAETAGEE